MAQEEIEEELNQMIIDLRYQLRHNSNPKHTVNRISYLKEMLKQLKENK